MSYIPVCRWKKHTVKVTPGVTWVLSEAWAISGDLPRSFPTSMVVRTVSLREVLAIMSAKWVWLGSLTIGLTVFFAVSATAQESPEVSTTPKILTLEDLERLALEKNPLLKQTGFEIQSARGKALQSGLKPNPIGSFSADELGDRTGPSGILTPQITQEFVLGGKLGLSRAVASREVDQATLFVELKKFEVLTNVRQGFYEVLTAQSRSQISEEIIKQAKSALEKAITLQKAKQIAELDVLTLQIDVQKASADLESTHRDWIAAWRRLAATLGFPDMPMAALRGEIEENLPVFDFERSKECILENHLSVQIAKVGITKAELSLRRAEAEKIPNVTLSTGYTRQSQNRSNDWLFGISVPLPIFNRNQGNILSAQAEVGKSHVEVERVRNELASRFASAYGQFEAAKNRANRYRTSILPATVKSLEYSERAYKAGLLDFERIIRAQRFVGEAKLEYAKTLGEAWQAASEIAGLLQTESWIDATKKP